MNFVSAWATAIVGAVAFAAFADMLMPEGNIKKYANLVLGLVIMTILINPLTKIKDIDLLKGEFQFNLNSSQNIDMNNTQKELIEKTYAAGLEREVANHMKKYGDVIAEVEINTEEGEDYGEITRINIWGVKHEDEPEAKNQLVNNFSDTAEVNFY